MRLSQHGGRKRLGDRRSARPHHRVGRGQQVVDEFGVGLRVRDHAVLRPAQEPEQGSVAAAFDVSPRCRPSAQRVTLRRLDLDHLSAAVGQKLGAVRTGDAGGEFDDGVAVQRAGMLALGHGQAPTAIVAEGLDVRTSGPSGVINTASRPNTAPTPDSQT